MKYKKMLAVMLTTSIAASAVPMTAWAEEGEEPNLVSEATEVQEEPEAPQEDSAGPAEESDMESVAQLAQADEQQKNVETIENTDEQQEAKEVIDTAEELQKALDDAEAGDIITLGGSFEVDGENPIKITKKVVLNGNGHTITATGEWKVSSYKNVITVTADDVEIQNLNLDCGVCDVSGIHVYNCKGVNLNGVEITNFQKAGVIVNGAEVTATDLVVEGTKDCWGSVNVDDKAGEQPKFTFESGTLKDAVQIYDEVEDATVAVVVAEGMEAVTIDKETGKKFYTDNIEKLAAAKGGIYNADQKVIYDNLATAVEKAAENDTIRLYTDITLEAGVANNIKLNKAITIDGQKHSISRTFSSDAEYEAAFEVSANGVTIQNVVVKGTGAAGREDAAFYLGYGANENIRIENCKFEGTGKNPASGIISAYGTADKLTVKGCEFSNAKYGMYFNGINNATIEGNKVQNTQYNGIYIADDTTVARQNVVIQNNTLSEIGTKNYSEQYGSGIYVEEATGAGDSAVQVSGNSVTLDSANDKGKPIVNGNSILVTGIELNQTTLSLRVGRTAQLKATVTPENATDKTVTWKSSDTSVATVDENGIVTAEGRGNATITASAGNGAEATCDVTVKKKSSSSGGSSSSSSTDKEYSIAIDKDIDNGKVKVDPSKAEKGDKVTITVTPDKGYEISKVVVKDADGEKLEVKDKGKGEYTFTMPDSKVEIDAKFVKAEEEKPEAPAEAKTIILTIDQKIANVFGEYVVNDVAPIIRNERTMLPIRFIAQNLGAEVAWDDALNKVTITKDDLKIELYINSAVAVVNGENVTLDAPAFIENSRTYLPLRFVAENLGATVTWDAAARQVTIQK